MFSVHYEERYIQGGIDPQKFYTQKVLFLK